MFCNQYVSEIAPKEVSGPAGSVMQVSAVFGGLITTAFGLVRFNENDTNKLEQKLTVLLLTPAILSAIQLILLLIFFRIDTPVYYNQCGDVHKMREALQFVYKEEVIESKANEIMFGDPNDGLPKMLDDEEEDIGYKDICCNHNYKRATILGVLLAVFQQMTGVNIIYFYSN